jgi:hypothetical protein
MDPELGALIYDKVQFHFVIGGQGRQSVNGRSLDGWVKFHDGKMILYIPGPVNGVDPANYNKGPYLVVGRSCGHWFMGTNNDPNGNSMNANWADVGIAWAGIWHEWGDEFHFSFVLNRAEAILVTDRE